MSTAFSLVNSKPTMVRGLINPSLMSHTTLESQLSVPKKIDPGAPPEVKPPVVMPDQQAIDDEKKRSIADQLSRRGRASTILTDQNDRLGG